MRALRCADERSIDHLVVEQVDDPVAGPGSVVVRVDAAAVNYVDALTVTGDYQLPATPPFTPGNDFAGEVLAAGDGCTLAPGDRVHGLTFLGAFAEQMAVPERLLRRSRPGLSAELACLAGSCYRTGYDAVVSTGELEAGETLVVLGASGAVGSAAVQVGKALGARVIACASSSEKLEFCASVGADDTVDYATEDLKARLKELCPAGADLVIDPVGGDVSEPALRATGYGGRFVVVGFASGAIPRIPLNLVLLKGVIVKGYEIVDFQRKQPEVAAANRDTLEAMLADGRLNPPITRRFPLDQGAEALRVARGRDKYGHIILLPNG